MATPNTSPNSNPDRNLTPERHTTPEMALNQARQRWQRATGAEVITPMQLLAHKERDELYIVGVTGFYGEWSEKRLAEDTELFETARAADVRLDWALTDLKARHGEKLIVLTRGNGDGISGIARDLCERREIRSVGIVTSRDLPKGGIEPSTLVFAGATKEDSSESLVRLSNRLMVLGGDNVARGEARSFAASNDFRDLLIYPLFGGAVGKLTGGKIHAMFMMG